MNENHSLQLTPFSETKLKITIVEHFMKGVSTKKVIHRKVVLFPCNNTNN